MLHMRHGVASCALLLLVLTDTANVLEASGSPPFQSNPSPLTSYRPLRFYEVIQIGEVVDTPQTWNLRLVRFKGKVTSLRTIPRGIAMVPRETHVFTLTDDTGEIEIFYTGTHGYIGPLNTAMVFDGNMVDVLVTITNVSLSGSEGETLAAKLRWIEWPED